MSEPLSHTIKNSDGCISGKFYEERKSEGVFNNDVIAVSSNNNSIEQVNDISIQEEGDIFKRENTIDDR